MGPKAASTGGPKSILPNKRTLPPGGGGGGGNGGRNDDAARQKRAKVHIARNIPVQQADAALKDGELDLQAFVAAHEFEIRSLEQSMATSKAVSSIRAFQKVPRGLRRRTASHNPKRVPRRLKARAMREMAEDKTPLVQARRRRPTTTRARIRWETAKKLRLLAARSKARQLKRQQSKDSQGAGGDSGPMPETVTEGVVGRKPRPKIRRNLLNDPPRPASKFRRRQINKTWLPTHTWLAKRARMTDPKDPLWRFAIPLTPNEKVYRLTHRAQGERGTMVWDMSYVSTIGVSGPVDGLEKVLTRVGVSQPQSHAHSLWGERGKKWRTGVTAWSGMLSKDVDGQRRQLCPATVLWNPARSQGQDDKHDGQVFVRLHPSAFLQVFNELLSLIKAFKPRVYVEDLRFEIGSIELTGPASTEALLAVLTPFATKDCPESSHAAIFESLEGLTNPASIPANAILSFTIQDPRLRYPPRKRTFADGSDAQIALLNTLADWPADKGLEPSPLFDRDARHRASCLPTQKSINRRRGNATVAPSSSSSSYLSPTRVDPPIPIILMATRPTTSSNSTQKQGTWTLLAPWKCILPLWYGLVHVPLVSGFNPRFGGLDEIRHVAFDRGVPWFPADYPATDAGAEWEQEQRRKRRRDWERRPKSKRTEWSAVDLGAGRKGELGDGHACDFELLFGLSKAEKNGTPEAGEEAKQDVQSETSKDVAADQEMEGSEEAASTDPTSEEVETLKKQPDKKELSRAKKASSAPSLRRLNLVTKVDFDSLITNAPNPISLPPNALIQVRLSLLGRGVVQPCARIYRLPSPPPSPPPPSNLIPPAPTPPETGIDVPATPDPPPPPSIPGMGQSPSCDLPPNLRAQWLARLPPEHHHHYCHKGAQPRQQQQHHHHHHHRRRRGGKPHNEALSMEMRKRLLAQELIATANDTNIDSGEGGGEGNTHHPPVPSAKDLIGFVTTGAFCLSDGRAAAIGSIAVDAVMSDVRADGRVGRLCVVRNAGEAVGWLARWDAL